MSDNYNFNGMEQPPLPPKRKSNTPKVLALIAAVAVVGAGAGFGGAFLAGRAGQSALITSDSGYYEDSDKGSSSRTDHDDSQPDATESVSKPSLGEMQSGATIQHNISDKAEFNTDGTFMYTRDLVAAVRDSIVYIEVYVDYRGEPTLYGAGSGIVISEDGYIITNAHVVDNMDSYTVSVTTTDPVEGTGVAEKYDAVLVGSDTDTDLAVLKIEAKDLQPAVLGDSDELHLGDDVVAIGNPLGLETSVSKGIISGLNRQISSSERGLSSIQTDAAINSGNSGGALFNMYGEVIGVVNEKLISNYAENVGFAITINEAKTVIDDLITKGYVTGRPILGITCLQVSEYVASIQGMTPGLLITEIDQSLPIAKSELVVGDTITAVEGTYVTTTTEVASILNEFKPGDVVTVTVIRTDSLGRNREYDFKVELAEYSGS